MHPANSVLHAYTIIAACIAARVTRWESFFTMRNNGLGPRRLSQESEAEKATPPPPAAGERRPASRDDDPGDRRVGPESYSWPPANSRTIAPTKFLASPKSISVLSM